MRLHVDPDSVARSLGAISALTEGKFLEIGEKLESSIGTLQALNGTFARLQQDLDSDAVRQAASDIRTAAGRVIDFANGHAAEKDAVTRIGGIVAGVDLSVSTISGAVRGADILAVSARIAAANLGGAGGDFSEFADEIARTLKLAQGTLERFRQELADTVRHLHAARVGQSALDRGQNGAMQGDVEAGHDSIGLNGMNQYPPGFRLAERPFIEESRHEADRPHLAHER